MRSVRPCQSSRDVSTTSTRIIGQRLLCASGQRRPGLEGGDPQTAPGQRERGLARAGADLEDAVARPYGRELDEPVEQPLGVVGPGVVVEVGGLVEGRPEPLAVVVHGSSLALRAAARGQVVVGRRHGDA